jgi:hypothetical protein
VKLSFAFAIGFWLFIGAMVILFIRGAGHQKRFERRQYRDRQPPSYHVFTATHNLLMLVQIGCAAIGVIALVLLFLFGDEVLNLFWSLTCAQ